MIPIWDQHAVQEETELAMEQQTGSKQEKEYVEGGVISLSEVIDISPDNLDSNLCFFQPSISHNVLCI